MTEIHQASEASPILTKYEPGFRRVYAKGGLVRKDGEPEEGMLRLAFWSSKQDVHMESEDGETSGVGYSLETEVVLTERAAERLRDLLTYWLARAQNPPRSP